MMNPQMMQQAQQMMANMTPEQMANMQQMVQNMTPEQMANMQRMANGMGMGGAPGASPGGGMSGQAQYALNGARMLKDEGNTLHKAGNHSEAITKYERALKNLETEQSPEAVELKTSCELNTAMCQLKLGQWQPCEKTCSKVLLRGPNLKAYYRRGQAYMGQQSWADAVKDLKLAYNMCPGGDPQRALIKEKLEESQEHAPEAAASPTKATAPPASYNDGSIVIEEVTEEEAAEIQPAAAAAPPLTPAPAYVPNAAGASDYVARMMQNDPEHAKKMVEQMSSIPSEEFARMANAAGMPGLDASAAKQMADMMKNMSPEQLQDMAKMAEQMHGSGAAPVAPGTAAGALAPPVNPNMAAEMLQKMSPDQMANMAKAAKDAGVLPAGMEFDADMVKMSAEMMKNMSKEDIARMQAMAQASRPGAGSAAPSGTRAAAGGSAMGPTPSAGTPTGSMAEMLDNPEAMKAAMNMMKNMDKEQVVRMLKMSQPNMSDEDAQRAAEQMKNMDERMMGWVLKGAAGVQKAKLAFANTKEWLLARPAVLVALAVLLLAIVLRVYNVL